MTTRGSAERDEPLKHFARRSNADDANPWAASSETVDGCLRGVSPRVAEDVDDRASLECILADVFVDNLDVLVSCLADRDKLRCLLSSADRLLERRTRSERIACRVRGDI